MVDDTHTSMMKEAETEGTGRRNQLKKVTIPRTVFWVFVAGFVLRVLFLIGGSDDSPTVRTPAVATPPVATPLPDGSAVVAWNTPLGPQAVIVRERNTSAKCPGILPFRWLNETVEDNFNPNGCWVYWKCDVAGTVKLIGSVASRTITKGPSRGGAWTVYSAKAAGPGKTGWQPILYDSGQTDLDTKGCDDS